MSGPRQTRLRLLFSKNETDVSEDLCKDLLSWSFTDHESGQADEISLTLKDNEGKWAGSWKPDGGENIKMYLVRRHHGRTWAGGLPRNILC